MHEVICWPAISRSNMDAMDIVGLHKSNLLRVSENSSSQDSIYTKIDGFKMNRWRRMLVINMIRKLLVVGLILLGNGLFVSVAHSAFYKWVDKKGQVHYTQTPPPASQIQTNSMSKAMSGNAEEKKLVKALIGNWSGTRKDERVFLEFNVDGRFEDRTKTDKRFVQNGVGKWKVSGEMIKWEYESGKGNWSYSKGKEKHFSFVEEISENKLIIREPDGELTKLTRVGTEENPNSASQKDMARATECKKAFSKTMTDGQKWASIIKNNCTERAVTLLNKGLDPNAVASNKTPLTYAIEMKRKAIAKLLIKNGANIDLARKSDGATPLILAAEMGDYQLVNTLIGVGASMEAYDREKSTALIVAAKENREIIVKRLLSMGANVNAADDAGLTALKHAQDRGHQKIVKTILDYKKLTGSK